MSIEMIDEFLRQVDIEGLIAGGAPADEYESEARILYRTIREFESEEITVDVLVSVLAEIWRQSFSLDGDGLLLRQTGFQSVAQKIVNAGIV